MSVVTFVYVDKTFMRIPRDEIRGVSTQDLHTDGRGESHLNLGIMLSSVHPQSGWLMVLVGSVTDQNYSVRRRPGLDHDPAAFDRQEDEYKATYESLKAARTAMIEDLGSSIDIDVTYTQTRSPSLPKSFIWVRTEGRPK